MISKSINASIATAMKAGDKVRVAVLRLLSSELHNEWISKQRDLSYEEEILIVRKEIKKRQDAILIYEKAGKSDRVDIEKREIQILQEFLPAELSYEEIGKLAEESISRLNASYSDLGKVIGDVKSKVGVRAEGAKIAEIVKQKLLNS